MKKKVLVTAGNTRVPIDKVRGLDNIFKGATGAAIATYFAKMGCNVTILASHPENIQSDEVHIRKYSTFDELKEQMETLIRTVAFDVIIHSAAVSDFRVDAVYRQIGSPTEVVDPSGHIHIELSKLNSSGKIDSDHSELWMKLTPTPKIVDLIRDPWGFTGTLVKFKLQVGIVDEELIAIAKSSMHHSKANFIIANTLEGMLNRAYILSDREAAPVCVSRQDLPTCLYKALGL